MEFYSKDNLKLLVTIFKEYMSNKLNIKLQDEDDAILRKTMHDTMVIIANENIGKKNSLQILNTSTLQIVRDKFLKRLKPVSPVETGETSQSLNRDKTIFGNRPLNTAVIIPEAEPYAKKPEINNDGMMDRLILEREREIGNEKKIIKENIIKPATTETAENVDDFMKKLKDFENRRNSILDDTPNLDINKITIKNDTLFQEPINKKTISTPFYISINSFNRSLKDNPLRYNYNVSVKECLIETFELKRLVIPDIIFNFPYLIVQIGIDSSFDIGIFKMIYHSSYKTQNRGYIILVPSQDEKIVFKRTVSTLSISILQPTGMIYNKTDDIINIINIQYDTAKKMLKVTTDLFFNDKDLTLNDLLILKDINHKDKDIFDFLNRKEGFEIKELGIKNDNGYYNSFYIESPGIMNRSTGVFEINASILKNLEDFNGYAKIINMSLQNSLAVTIYG